MLMGGFSTLFNTEFAGLDFCYRLYKRGFCVKFDPYQQLHLVQPSDKALMFPLADHFIFFWVHARDWWYRVCHIWVLVMILLLFRISYQRAFFRACFQLFRIRRCRSCNYALVSDRQLLSLFRGGSC